MNVESKRVSENGSLTPFPYARLLAYRRGELHDPLERAVIEEKLVDDPRWRAHWESVRRIDLERIAASQDARDLEAFSTPTDFCRAVAQSGGEVLRDLVRKRGDEAGGWSWQQWSEHIDGCVYCRRMRRRMTAKVQAEESGLPEGEILLREWLLEPEYLAQINAVTGSLLGLEPPPEPPGEKFGGDIFVDGPSVLVRTDLASFLDQIGPVVRLLMRDVLGSDSLADAFLGYLRQEHVLARLRSVVHVRDEIGPVLADFCRQEGLRDAEEVKRIVTRETMDKVLLRVAVLKLKEEVTPGPEREALARAAEKLEAAEANPVDSVNAALREALPTEPEKAQRLRNRLLIELAVLSR
jgi:hypothetical protein